MIFAGAAIPDRGMDDGKNAVRRRSTAGSMTHALQHRQQAADPHTEQADQLDAPPGIQAAEVGERAASMATTVGLQPRPLGEVMGGFLYAIAALEEPAR
jgi:hypothetical protein